MNQEKASVPQEAVELTEAIKNAPSFNRAIAVLHEGIEGKVQINNVTFFTLLRTAKSFEERLRVYKTMQVFGIAPSRVFYQTWMKMSDSPTERLDVHNIAKSHNDQNVEVFNTWLGVAESHDEINVTLEIMRSNKIKSSAKTFSVLFSRAVSADARKELNAMMTAQGIPHNVDTIGVWLSNAESSVERNKVLEIAKLKGVQLNTFVYSNLLAEARSPSEREALNVTMGRTGVQHDTNTIQAWLNNVDSSEEGFKVVYLIPDAQQSKVKLDMATVEKLYRILLSENRGRINQAAFKRIEALVKQHGLETKMKGNPMALLARATTYLYTPGYEKDGIKLLYIIAQSNLKTDQLIRALTTIFAVLPNNNPLVMAVRGLKIPHSIMQEALNGQHKFWDLHNQWMLEDAARLKERYSNSGRVFTEGARPVDNAAARVTDYHRQNPGQPYYKGG